MIFVTRRTDGRLFRLLGPDIAAAFAVILAGATERTGVRLACLGVLSNHYHAVLWDPEGLLADFLRDLHAQVARFGNYLDEVDLHFWDGQQTFIEVLYDADAVIAKMAYVIANPVKHRLVASPEAWQGLMTRIDDIGSGRGPSYERPGVFFADDSAVPQQAELLSFVPPMCEKAYGVEGFKKRLRAAVQRLVDEARAAAREDGRGFVGMEAVLGRGRLERPSTPSGRSAGRNAEAGRRIAASERAAIEAEIVRQKQFREQHRAARELFRRGDRDVLFPAGTWFAWRYFGAKRVGDEPAALAGA